MSKVKSRFRFGTKGGSADGLSKSNELSECKKFYSNLPKVLTGVLQPGHHSMTGKNNANYEEKNLVKFLEKQKVNLTGSLQNAVGEMSSTYTQIVDLKGERDLRIQADLYDPIKESILHDLNHISKLKKSVSSMESEVATARKNFEKNPQDTLASEKLSRATGALEQAREGHDRAVNAFKQDESKRLAMLRESAQIQQEFYKKAADNFAQLVSNLNAIQEQASSVGYSLNQNGMPEISTAYDVPQPNFGYTTTVKGNVARPGNETKSTSGLGQCKALYDFEAEAEDDLSLKKGDIATILEKVDDQWYYGEKGGKTGHFPVEFVERI
ncbi:hypothetical protein Aperf_G00000062962 [Anoplocephala perfoliata]